MQPSLPNIPTDNQCTFQWGIDTLLNDFETAAYLKGPFILGIANLENPGKMDPAQAEFFLNLYCDAYLSERKAFSIIGEDMGRTSWIAFIGDQLKHHRGTENLELTDDERTSVYNEFLEYANHYAKTVTVRRSPVFPIFDATRNSLNGIVE